MSTVFASRYEAASAVWIRRIALGLLWAWVGFWCWFVVASHYAEGVALTLEGGTVVLPIMVGAALAHRRPFAAAIVLAAYAVVSAVCFRNAAAWSVLSAPALVFAVYFGVSARRRR